MQRLLGGLTAIGDALDLKVFTAGDGIALLDWRSQRHELLTVWVHAEGVDIRLGASIHTLVTAETPEEVDDLLALLRRVVVEGTWFETYVVDPQTGEAESLSWRLGVGRGTSYGVQAPAHQRAGGTKIYHRGRPWGRRGKRSATPLP